MNQVKRRKTICQAFMPAARLADRETDDSTVV
jgi:hypothetical protein